MPTVLIIDDSPTQVACIRQLLEGLRVLHRNSASLRESGLVPEQVDLVLIALILREQNGFECGLQLRESGFRNIVLYSDCPEDTDADWARAIGLQGLLQLPAPTHSLLQQIKHSLSRTGQGHEDGQRWAS
tara:strand:- start:8896 stop:9285 length:390 start_codon:yes stop_codon:yes gene_type:complete